MKTESTKAAFFTLRISVGFALCSFGLLLALAGFSQSVTGMVVTSPDSAKWYVNGVHGSDSNDCKSPATPCKTIGHTISLAAADDSIIVGAATYTEHLTIGVSLTILGSNANSTVIDGGGVGVVVTILSGVQVTLSKFTIQNGNGGDAGGIANYGTLTVNNSTLSGNTAVAGGGIYNEGTLTINNSTLSENVARGGFFPGSGGGIFSRATLTINNSTLSGNTAGSVRGSAFGGGIYSTGMLTVDNSTLSENAASGFTSSQGGNIFNGGTAIFQNSIVADAPSGGNCSGSITSVGYNLSSDSTCGFNNTGDLNNTDPLLGPLQDNGGPTETLALLPGSPAIDAGNPGGCSDGQGRLLRTDQRHMPRPDHEDTSGCDMGAYESQSD